MFRKMPIRLHAYLVIPIPISVSAFQMPRHTCNPRPDQNDLIVTKNPTQDAKEFEFWLSPSMSYHIVARQRAGKMIRHTVAADKSLQRNYNCIQYQLIDKIISDYYRNNKFIEPCLSYYLCE